MDNKELLLKDLSARLPYEVILSIGIFDNGSIKYHDKKLDYHNDWLSLIKLDGGYYFNGLLCKYPQFTAKPYLRPMSSMTEEEKEELLNLLFDKEAKYFYIDEEGFIDGKTSDLMKEGFNYPSFCPINIELYTDFLLSHHFDYRGLIEKKLAIETPDGMYK